MTLQEAIKHIELCGEQMRSRYNQRPVFDEWAVVSFSENKGRVLYYVGPRREGFVQNFSADAGGLRSGLFADQHQPGDFDFSRHAVGTGFEAFLILGVGVYLICNNTTQSMDAIAKDPFWIQAQVPFVELSEKVRANPLV